MVTPREDEQGRYFEYAGRGVLHRIFAGELPFGLTELDGPKSEAGVAKPNTTKVVPPG